MPLTVAVTLILGFGVAMVIIPAQTLMQGQTPMEMLGRVTSSLMSVLSFAQVCGLVLSGSIAQAIGIRNSYFATSALLALIALRARLPGAIAVVWLCIGIGLLDTVNAIIQSVRPLLPMRPPSAPMPR